jgi:hypothetical protein
VKARDSVSLGLTVRLEADAVDRMFVLVAIHQVVTSLGRIRWDDDAWWWEQAGQLAWPLALEGALADAVTALAGRPERARCARCGAYVEPDGCDCDLHLPEAPARVGDDPEFRPDPDETFVAMALECHAGGEQAAQGYHEETAALEALAAEMFARMSRAELGRAMELLAGRIARREADRAEVTR